MNIFHPLAHAMSLVSSSPVLPSHQGMSLGSGLVQSAAGYVDHSGEERVSQHHDEDVGSDHCDVCHISGHSFIIVSYGYECSATGQEKGCNLLSFPTSYLLQTRDRPPILIG